MLNQLPPAQRQQAQRALEQMQQPSGESSQLTTLAENIGSESRKIDATLNDVSSVLDEPRAKANSTLVVSLTPKSDLSAEQSRRFESEPALTGIQGTHVYYLDDTGSLKLPGLTVVSLLGLDNIQIDKRLRAEPALDFFDIDVTILESVPTGLAALKPFGYDLFESNDYGFDPVSTGPVPLDYVLGPGDSVRVQLFGNISQIYEFEVSRDGVLNLPELGPVTVAGLPFSEFRQDIDRRVQETLIGTQVSVTMGQLRTIRVFVLGDANRPGSYVVSSLATIISAIYQSGGISGIGSLRDIQLKRNGVLIARIDLYDLLLRGDNSGDSRLQAGDVIFVPPVGAQISVGGAVKRPAIYEARRDLAVVDVIQMAGGLTADAFPDGAVVERIDSRKQRTVLAVDAAAGDESVMLRGGDVLSVPRVLPELRATVQLMGHVYRPGPYQWKPGLRLTDLIVGRSALRPGADANYVLIRRENSVDGSIRALSGDLEKALANPGSEEDMLLQSRDQVNVFSVAYGRQRVVDPILEELKLQARFGEPYREVSVSGRVQAPGTYPLEPDMRVSDLIRAGGNLAEDAYPIEAELVRYDIVDGDYRETDVIDIDLSAILRGEGAADLVVKEHDNLRVSGLPDWDSQWAVSLEGEVKFPGPYRIRRGEKLSELIQRAGGLKESAFPEGAIFLRDSLRAREQEQIEILAKRLESDLTSLALAEDQLSGSDTLETGRNLLAQLRSTQAVGRLVIELGDLQGDRNNFNDVELRDGDRLLVPKIAQEVTVLGETQQNASHLFKFGLTRDDYISMSGGMTRRADKKLIYIVRASGAVIPSDRSRWFARRSASEILPGDTIVVPLETDRVRPLTLWTNVTQILYQAAIAVAAIKTFQ